MLTNGAVDGVRGAILEPSDVPRGVKSSRTVVGEFALRAGAVIVASGGIGGNHDLVRQNWPKRLGEPPGFMVQGVPDHVDGRMLAITEAAGARLINRDRMWHYTEGLRNWNPIWPNHGIRILPGPSSLWLDATGKRLPPPLYPGFDTLGTLEYIAKSGHEHSWFLLNQAIIKREFALSGSEQNPDLTNKDWRQTLGRAFSKTATGPVEAFKKHGADFVIKDNLADLVAGMNALTAAPLLEFATVEREVIARDRQLDNPFGKDSQLAMIRQARKYLGDKLIRVAKPHALLDPKAGPLIAVKLNILTRKTLGGFETDLSRPRVRNRRRDPARTVRGGRGGRLRRRRRARLSVARGHVPGRLHLLRPQRGAGGRRGCLKHLRSSAAARLISASFHARGHASRFGRPRKLLIISLAYPNRDRLQMSYSDPLRSLLNSAREHRSDPEASLADASRSWISR